MLRIATAIIALSTGIMSGKPAAADPSSAEAGKAVFLNEAQPPCGTCHTLADAGTQGEIGPVLDDLKPDANRVIAAVTNGIGVMPAYEDLSEDQIKAVAEYVAGATGAAQ